MSAFAYHDSEFPIRDPLRVAHAFVWDGVAAAGSAWNGAERVRIAALARLARSNRAEPLLVLLIDSLKRGLLAMVPNLIPIWMVLGLMGWLDIPLDNSSLLIGCIIIGLAVDDTIHFMHEFQRYYAQVGDAREAVRRTLETTGAALLFTSLVLGSGFAVMVLATRNAGSRPQLASAAPALE